MEDVDINCIVECGEVLLQSATTTEATDLLYLERRLALDVPSPMGRRFLETWINFVQM